MPEPEPQTMFNSKFLKSIEGSEDIIHINQTSLTKKSVYMWNVDGLKMDIVWQNLTSNSWLY